MDKKFIRQQLAGTFDSVRIDKDGFVICKRGFFYRNGCDAQKLADAVKKLIPGVVNMEAREYWNRWPRDSYWRVTFCVNDEPAPCPSCGRYNCGCGRP